MATIDPNVVAPVEPVATAPVTQPVTQTPILPALNASAVYSPLNVQQVLTGSTSSYKNMKLSKLEKKIADANSLAEMNAINIKNQPVAMGVATGQAAHQSAIDTARLNSVTGLYNVKLLDEQRKEAERQQFISTYGADPSQRPKGMSKREFSAALAGGKFSNLLTVDYKTKQAALKKALAPSEGSTGTWTVQTDPNTGEQFMFNNKTAQSKPMGSAGTETSSDQTQIDTMAAFAQTQKDQGKSWDETYQALKEKGFDATSTGSVGDLALNKVYNPENYQTMISARGATSQYQSLLSDRTPEQQLSFNTLSPTDQSNVAQLLNGDVLLSDLMASRGIQGSAMRQKLLEKARMIDPTFSENINKQRYAFKTQWNNPQGKQFITRTAINTAMGHLSEATVAFQDLAKVDAGVLTLKGNELKNWLNKNSGSGEVQAFNTARDLLATELATVYKGGVPDAPEINRMLENMDGALSAGGFSAVANMTASLLGSKINATATEYKTIMGNNPNEPLVSPQALDSLYNAGIDTSAIAKDLQRQGYKIEQKYLDGPPKTTSDPDEWLKSTTVDGGHVSEGINNWLSQQGY